MTFDIILQTIQSQALHMAEAGAIVVALLEALKRIGLDVGKLPQRMQPLVAPVATGALLLWMARDDGLGWALCGIVAVVNGLLGGLGAIGTYHAVRKVARGGASGKPPKEAVPPTPRTGTAVVTGGIVLLLTGCAGSFETARVAGVDTTTARKAEPPSRYCERIDSQRRWWSGVAQGAAVLAGAEGLTAIPVEDDRAELGLAIGGAAMGAASVGAAWVANDLAEAWARDCATAQARALTRARP